MNKKIISLLALVLFIYLPQLNASGNKVNVTDSNNSNDLSNIFEIFRNQLIDSEDYLITENNKVKISLLKENEYELIGENSYLNNGKEILLDERTKYITVKGIIEDTVSTSSYYTKGIVYVGPETVVTGTGSKSKPYKFSNANDLNITKITVNGIVSNTTPLSGTYNLNYNCRNRAYVEWNNTTHELTFSDFRAPVSCVLEFTSE